MTQQEKMDFPITLRVQSNSYRFNSGQAQFVASTLNFQTIQIWRKKLLKVYAWYLKPRKNYKNWIAKKPSSWQISELMISPKRPFFIYQKKKKRFNSLNQFIFQSTLLYWMLFKKKKKLQRILIKHSLLTTDTHYYITILILISTRE